jgi:hypothetical protein
VWEPRCRPRFICDVLPQEGRYPLPQHGTAQRTMGFRQRERRRKRRAAQQSAAAASRLTGSSAAKWWLTVVISKTCCARCGLILIAGAEMVYRHRPLEALCVPCGESDPDVRQSWRPSIRWERSR